MWMVVRSWGSRPRAEADMLVQTGLHGRDGDNLRPKGPTGGDQSCEPVG